MSPPRRKRTTAPRPKRSRRSSADVRDRLIEAARELFPAAGYDATTTREIAERAGVAEPLLFSNFGSKAGLFEAAVLNPIADFVAEYAGAWRGMESELPEERADAFVRGLFELAQRNRAMLLSALIQRLSGGSAQGDDVLDRLAGALQGLSGVSNLDRYEDVDAPAAFTSVVGMVLGVALLDDLLFASRTRRPGRERLIAEMEKLILHGTTNRRAEDRVVPVLTATQPRREHDEQDDRSGGRTGVRA
jgi:AcrR family transcriptional regulator